MLAHKIKDKKYLKLTWEILQTCEQGLAIGFFICQWLANFYLEPLDRYITTLDGVKYSVRYMDDIVLFGPNKKKRTVRGKRLPSICKSGCGCR